MGFISSTNIQWIEYLQEQLIGSFPSNETALRYQFGKKKVFSTSDMLHLHYFPTHQGKVDVQDEAFSRYEHPRSKEMLALLNDRFWRAVKHLKPHAEGFQIRENVTLGCLPLGYLNALATKGPGGDYVILLNDGLFPLARCLSEIFVLSLEETETSFHIPSGDLLKTAVEDERLVSLFREVFLDYLTSGSVEGLGSNEIYVDGRGDRLKIASCMVHSLLMFVLAHEYAHIFCGHLDQARPDGAENPEKRRAQELSSDLFSTGITVFYDNYHTRMGVSLASLGINLFFLIDELFHPRQHSGSREEPEEPYPSTRLRREACLYKIYSLVSYQDYSVTVDVWNDLVQLFSGWRAALKNPFSTPEDLAEFLDRKQRRRGAILDVIDSIARGKFRREEGQDQQVILY